MPAEKRNAEESSLGQKTERYRQTNEQAWDVHGARVVGAEDDRFVGIDVLNAFYAEPYPTGLENQPGPCPRARVLPAAVGVKE